MFSRYGGTTAGTAHAAPAASPFSPHGLKVSASRRRPLENAINKLNRFHTPQNAKRKDERTKHLKYSIQAIEIDIKSTLLEVWKNR